MSTRDADKKLYGRRGYPADLKKKVLAHLAERETSLRETSKHFNISVPTLMKWRKESLAGAGEASAQSGSLKPASTEVERLQAEVEQLRAERDRLRRGIAILVGLEVSE